MEITYLNFSEISKNNEFFLWHFLVPEKTSLELQSYNSIIHERNILKEIIDITKIPYFESKVKNEVNFLSNLKNGYSKLMWNPVEGYNPVILGFNYGRLVYSTWQDFCYCKEGLIGMIYGLNPEFINQIDLD